MSGQDRTHQPVSDLQELILSLNSMADVFPV